MTRDLLRQTGVSILTAAAIVMWGCSANAGMLLNDPAGDTFGYTGDPNDPGEPQFDIETASTDLTTSPGNIIFSVTFYTPPEIALPSAQTLNSIDLRIDIDVDQNPLTGGTSNLVTLGQGVPAPGLGVDFYFELSHDELFDPGMAALLDDTLTQVGPLLAVTLTPSTFSVTIPLITLGLLPGEEVNFGVIVGPLGGTSATDQVTFAANGVVPEPASVATMLIGVGFLVGSRYPRRRKTQARHRDLHGA